MSAAANAAWPPPRSVIEESSLERVICELWTFPQRQGFGGGVDNAKAWARVADYLWGASLVFNYASAVNELRWLARIALIHAELRHQITAVECEGMDQTVARAWCNARLGVVTWQAVADWLHTSPRFFRDREALHSELVWLSAVAKRHAELEARNA